MNVFNLGLQSVVKEARHQGERHIKTELM